MTRSTTRSTWAGMVPVDDTALAVTDTGGPGVPVVYLNGQFATQGYWRRVVAELGTGWRHITYDERARGRRSRTSADYSFAAAVRDVDAVLAARGVDRALVVGWSYGAFIGAHWVSRNPDRAIGAVLVDGAQPSDWMGGEITEEGIRKLFRRMSWLMALGRPTGLTPRMTVDQMADSNIELGRLASKRELGPVLDAVTVPVRYVLASGSSFGSKGDQQERIRADLDPVFERSAHIRLSAKVTSNHGAILRKDFRAVAEAVREVAALDRPGPPRSTTIHTTRGTTMTESAHTVELLPAARESGCPFDPPGELRRARNHGPISRYPFPGGHEGWLVTGYDLVRSVLADPRFSSRKELMRHPTIDFTGFEVPPAPPGEFLLMDEPLHGRYRRPLAGRFTARRMRLLTERVEQITAEHLDAMEAAGPPTDLVTAFARPIPAVMICELLGVPYADRGSFQAQVESFMSGETSDEDLFAAYAATQQYLAELVAAKRAHPTDDVLSDLTDSESVGGDLTDEELQGISLILLAAGLDTTANMLALGTFALLSDPAQWAALRAEPALTDQAVEELLRYLSVAKTFQRTALEDVELGGRTIKAGSVVLLSYHTANRDPERFADPDTLDVRRPATGHLAFGHGIHLCLGQQLARIEMRVAFPALVARFPTLRLDVAAEDVALRPETADVFGVKSLPVTWDT